MKEGPLKELSASSTIVKQETKKEESSSNFCQEIHHPRLPLWSPQEAQEKKHLYRQTARMRVKKVNFIHPSLLQEKSCCHQVPRSKHCVECFVASVKSLPHEPRLQVVKALSESGINKFLEGELRINGVRYWREGTYGDALQLLLARRLNVVKKVAIEAYELYKAEDGHTKARLITGEQVLCISQMVGSKRHELQQHAS